MRSAYEVAFVNAVNGTYGCAYSAVRAERIVDGCKIVNNLDSTRGTALFALHTADTAVFAIFTGVCTLVVIRAFNNNSGSIVYQLNNAVGAFSCAHSATDALLGIDMSYAV